MLVMKYVGRKGRMLFFQKDKGGYRYVGKGYHKSFHEPSKLRDRGIDGNSYIYVDNISLDDGGSSVPPGPVPNADVAFWGQCTGSGVNLRSGPGTNYEIMDGLAIDESVNAFTFTGVGTTDQQRSWLAMHHSGEYWYVYARYIGVNPNLSGSSDIGPIAYVSASSVNLRELPTTSSSAIHNLGYHVRMIVIDPNSVSGWWRVVTIYGTGWVSSQYVTYE